MFTRLSHVCLYVQLSYIFIYEICIYLDLICYLMKNLGFCEKFTWLENKIILIPPNREIAHF